MQTSDERPTPFLGSITGILIHWSGSLGSVILDSGTEPVHEFPYALCIAAECRTPTGFPTDRASAFQDTAEAEVQILCLSSFCFGSQLRTTSTCSRPLTKSLRFKLEEPWLPSASATLIPNPCTRRPWPVDLPTPKA